MGGSTDTTTSTTGPTNPMVDRTMTNLLEGLNSQVDRGTAVFNRPLYAGLSRTTQNGMAALNNAAQAGAGGLNDAYGWARGMVANGGFGEGQRSAMDTTRSVGDQFGSMASAAGNPSLTESTLMNVARGGAFGTNDPGYRQLRANLGDDTMSGINAAFNASGRFGGGSNVSSASEGLSNTLAGLDYSNFQNDQQRQMSALSAIEGMRQQGFNNRAGALSSQLAAAQSGFGMGQQGVANAGAAAAAIPGFYQATLQPGQVQMGVGQIADANNQARLMAENDLFRRTNDAGWATLGQASSILAGTAGAGGQQTSTTTPATPWWQTGLGLLGQFV